MRGPKAKVVQFQAKKAIMDNIILSFDYCISNNRQTEDGQAKIYSGTNQAKEK